MAVEAVPQYDQEMPHVEHEPAPIPPHNAPPAPQAVDPNMAVMYEFMAEMRARMARQEETIAGYLRGQQQQVPLAPQAAVPAVPVAPLAPDVPPVAVATFRPDYVERFMRLNCPSFGGTANPERAEDWITEAVTRMNLLNLNDRKRVKCAAYLLQGNART